MIAATWVPDILIKLVALLVSHVHWAAALVAVPLSLDVLE
jgi:hypothetical protein